MRKISTRIRELRIAQGLTQKQLADKINVSPQVVSNWERNYTSLDDGDIKRLVLALDTTADYLLGEGAREYQSTSEGNEHIIREIAEKYKLDLTEPNVKGKLEKIIQLVLDDISK